MSQKYEFPKIFKFKKICLKQIIFDVFWATDHKSGPNFEGLVHFTAFFIGTDQFLLKK